MIRGPAAARPSITNLKSEIVNCGGLVLPTARIPGCQPGDAGSIPARAAEQGWPVRLTAQDDRFSTCGWGFDSPTGHWNGDVDQRAGVATLRTWTVWVRIPPSPLRTPCRRVGARPGLISLEAGFNSRVCNSRPGRPIGRAGRSRACTVWVRLPPRSLQKTESPLSSELGPLAGESCALQARPRGSTPRGSTRTDGTRIRLAGPRC